MSSINVITEEGTVEQAHNGPVDAEDGVEVVDERAVLRPGVEQEIQAKVDANHPEGIRVEFSHLTLVEEERIQGREAELARISERARMGQQDGREQRTREVVCEERQKRRARQRVRDPRRALGRDQLALVNQEADRLVDELDGVSRAAISRTLAQKVRDGQSLVDAVFATLEDWKAEPSVRIPIDEIGEYGGSDVTIEGEVIELWDAGASPKVAQVGLIADESGKTKFTSWMKSGAKWVREGEVVRLVNVAANRYQGRWSVAVTGDSRIAFPERRALWNTR